MKITPGTFGKVVILIITAFLSLECLFELIITAGSDISVNYPYFIPGVIVLLGIMLFIATYTIKKLIAV